MQARGSGRALPCWHRQVSACRPPHLAFRRAACNCSCRLVGHRQGCATRRVRTYRRARYDEEHFHCREELVRLVRCSYNWVWIGGQVRLFELLAPSCWRRSFHPGGKRAGCVRRLWWYRWLRARSPCLQSISKDEGFRGDCCCSGVCNHDRLGLFDFSTPGGSLLPGGCAFFRNGSDCRSSAYDIGVPQGQHRKCRRHHWNGKPSHVLCVATCHNRARGRSSSRDGRFVRRLLCMHHPVSAVSSRAKSLDEEQQSITRQKAPHSKRCVPLATASRTRG